MPEAMGRIDSQDFLKGEACGRPSRELMSWNTERCRRKHDHAATGRTEAMDLSRMQGRRPGGR